MSDKGKEMELANGPSGDSNVKEVDAEIAAKKIPSGEAGDDEKMSITGMIKDKVINNLNVRINDFSNPFTLAICIGFFMLCGFIALVCVNYLVCPVNTTITRTVDYNSGVKEMQQGKIASIKNPSNAAELEDAGITRTAEICLNRGGLYVTEMIGAVAAVTIDSCILGTNEQMQEGGYDVVWCDGKEDDPDATVQCELNDVNNFIVEFVSTITEVQESCPTFSAALGAALAYITYLELFFTAVVGYLLIKLGICKPQNEKATVGNLLSSADNGTQEIEDMLEKLRSDVDKLMEGTTEGKTM